VWPSSSSPSAFRSFHSSFSFFFHLSLESLFTPFESPFFSTSNSDVFFHLQPAKKSAAKGSSKPAAAPAAAKAAPKAAPKASSKAAAKSGKQGKKPAGKGVAEVHKKIKKNSDLPLFDSKPRNFGIGNAIHPKRDLTRYVKWPKYVKMQRQRQVLLKRIKVPPALNQFSNALDKTTGNPHRNFSRGQFC
jgi:large subunit ribosomal protein L7Ae